MTQDQTAQRHVLSMIVDNEAGTLGRIAGLFSGRGHNIQSLTVAEIDKEQKLSRITITTEAPLHVIEHIVTLIARLIPIHRVKDLNVEGEFIQRGLLLVKVTAEENKRAEILHLADSFSAKEVDVTDSSFIFELTDDPVKLDEFIKVMEPYGIIEQSRTGITALSRGANAL
jgi:acetolactate synthase-1/3 small subunit